MTATDEALTTALEAFCRRLVEGHPTLPTGQSWEAIDDDTQNKIKTNFLGPLHAAAKALDDARLVELQRAAERDAARLFGEWAAQAVLCPARAQELKDHHNQARGAAAWLARREA